jgi:hypothetical protein
MMVDGDGDGDDDVDDVDDGDDEGDDDGIGYMYLPTYLPIARWCLVLLVLLRVMWKLGIGN